MRANLFHINGGAKEPLSLPDPVGASVTLSDKVYVPVKEHPEVSNALCGSSIHLASRDRAPSSFIYLVSWLLS